MLHTYTGAPNHLPDFKLTAALLPRTTGTTRKLYSSLDVDAAQIRLVSIAPARWSEDVRCKLEVVSLKENPSYEALSYTWGELSGTILIILDGVNLLITSNLHSALRRLRSGRDTRHIWIDALSINQKDKIEKARQILLMKEIYASAAEVQVYLGESGILDTITTAEQSRWAQPPRLQLYGDSRDQPQLVEFAAWQGTTTTQLERSSASHRKRQAIIGAYTILNALAKNQHIGACLVRNANPIVWREAISVLEHLASSPWWKRAWCVEEVILSGHATTIYGEVSAPLDILERGGSLIAIHLGRCCRNVGQNLPDYMRAALLAIESHFTLLERIRHDHYSFGGSEQAVQLQEFLKMTRSREAYDAGDRIYSLLGLIKDCPEPLDIPVNYSMPVSKLYINIALQVIQKTQSLEVLVTYQKKDPESEIPTWCPDWSRCENGEEHDAWMHSRSRRFKAGLSRGFVANLRHGRILALKGTQVDFVATITSPLSQDDELGPRLGEFARMVHYDTEPSSTYAGGGTTIRDAFWRTMLNDTINPEDNRSERLTSGDEGFFIWWWKLKAAGQQQGLIALPPEELIPAILRDVQPGVHELYTSLRADLQTIIGRSFWFPNDGRVFFVTKEGYTGFGPPDMQVDDVVAVILGSRVPFVLRPAKRPECGAVYEDLGNEEYFSLVGACYLHGVMDGEAVREIADIRDIYLL